MGSTGQVIVDSLVANGIDRVFCVPEYPGRVVDTSFEAVLQEH
jgi:hypothetical protein